MKYSMLDVALGMLVAVRSKFPVIESTHGQVLQRTQSKSSRARFKLPRALRNRTPGADFRGCVASPGAAGEGIEYAQGACDM